MSDQYEGVLTREDMAPPNTVEKSKTKPSDEGVLSRDDMQAKTEQGEGIHPVSTSLGKVVSDNETDAAGNSPADLPEVGEGDAGVLGDRQLRASTDTESAPKKRSTKKR